MKSSVRYQYMFLVIFLLNLAIWIKVSTDIFLAFAPFLCLAVEGIREDEAMYATGDVQKEFEYGGNC